MIIYIDSITGTYGIASDLRIVDLEQVRQPGKTQWDILDDLQGLSDDGRCDFGNWWGAHFNQISTKT